MSGLFRRLSSRRSAGPEGNEPPTAAEPGATDAPAHTPDETGGRQSLLQDPAREDETTRILPGTDPHTFHSPRPGEPVGPATPTGDPLAAQTAPTDPLVGQVPVQP